MSQSAAPRRTAQTELLTTMVGGDLFKKTPFFSSVWSAIHGDAESKGVPMLARINFILDHMRPLDVHTTNDATRAAARAVLPPGASETTPSLFSALKAIPDASAAAPGAKKSDKDLPFSDPVSVRKATVRNTFAQHHFHFAFLIESLPLYNGTDEFQNHLFRFGKDFADMKASIRHLVASKDLLPTYELSLSVGSTAYPVAFHYELLNMAGGEPLYDTPLVRKCLAVLTGFEPLSLCRDLQKVSFVVQSRIKDRMDEATAVSWLEGWVESGPMKQPLGARMQAISPPMVTKAQQPQLAARAWLPQAEHTAELLALYAREHFDLTLVTDIFKHFPKRLPAYSIIYNKEMAELYRANHELVTLDLLPPCCKLL
jgi:hypothetical protein